VHLNDGLSSEQTYKNIMSNATGHIHKHAAKYFQKQQIPQMWILSLQVKWLFLLQIC